MNSPALPWSGRPTGAAGSLPSTAGHCVCTHTRAAHRTRGRCYSTRCTCPGWFPPITEAPR